MYPAIISAGRYLSVVRRRAGPATTPSGNGGGTLREVHCSLLSNALVKSLSSTFELFYQFSDKFCHRQRHGITTPAGIPTLRTRRTHLEVFRSLTPDNGQRKSRDPRKGWRKWDEPFGN